MPRRSKLSVTDLKDLAAELAPHELIWLAQEITEREEAAQFIRRTFPPAVAAKVDTILAMPQLARAALARQLANAITSEVANVDPPTPPAPPQSSRGHARGTGRKRRK